MYPKLRHLVRRHGPEAFRFIVVGGVATALQFGFYLLLIRWMNEYLALAVSYAISLAFNYFLSNYYTFKTAPNLRKSIGFCASHAVNFGMQSGLLSLYTSLGLSKEIAPIFIFPVVIPINFLLVRHVLKHWQ